MAIPQELISLALAIVMPPTVDFIRVKIGISNSKLAYSLALALSVLMSIISNILTKQVEPTFESVLVNFAIIFAVSQTIFKTYWEDSQPRKALVKRVS